MTDSDLLRKYVDDRDEGAFAQIVDRHIDMVYAAANRQLGRSSHAEDVTQAVFIVLAKKAAKVDGNTLTGWLVKAARLIAMQAVREEWRRKQREHQAAVMKAESYRPEDWERVGPIVDDALSRLGVKDRTAVVLRYLEGREIGEVAASLGVSEAAAAKRLSRALSKLRRFFGRRGVEMSSLTIGESLLHARTPAPSGLAGSSVAAAMGKGVSVAIGVSAAGSGAMAATALAHAAIDSAIFAGSAAWTYSVAAVVIASLGLGGYGTVRHIQNRNAAALRARIALQTQVAPIPAKIRVGIILSQFTAQGPHYTELPYGYKDGYLELFRALRTESNLEIVPVIETTVNEDPDLIATLQAEFRGKTPIDASNVLQLMTLDVIAAGRVWNETPQVLDAIEQSVRAGKGLLLVSGIGIETPGMSPGPVAQLNGLKEGIWEYCSEGADSEIAQPHPLLGNLKAGDSVSLPVNGECGILADGATGLLEVSNLDDIHEIGPMREIPSSYHFYPVIVSRLGQGRIVNCQFSSWDSVRDDLQKPTGGRFMVHCVEWLANHPLD